MGGAYRAFSSPEWKASCRSAAQWDNLRMLRSYAVALIDAPRRNAADLSLLFIPHLGDARPALLMVELS